MATSLWGCADCGTPYEDDLHSPQLKCPDCMKKDQRDFACGWFSLFWNELQKGHGRF